MWEGFVRQLLVIALMGMKDRRKIKKTRSASSVWKKQEKQFRSSCHFLSTDLLVAHELLVAISTRWLNPPMTSYPVSGVCKEGLVVKSMNGN